MDIVLAYDLVPKKKKKEVIKNEINASQTV